jgi:hypothetical protein
VGLNSRFASLIKTNRDDNYRVKKEKCKVMEDQRERVSYRVSDTPGISGAPVMGPDWNVSHLLIDRDSLERIRRQAIQEFAKADPKNIQEVAASQLAIVNSYYQSKPVTTELSLVAHLGRDRVRFFSCGCRGSSVSPISKCSYCEWYCWGIGAGICRYLSLPL